MRKIAAIIGIIILSCLFICGLIVGAHDIKRGSDIRHERERMQFLRDSLGVELLKKELSK